MAVPIMPAPVRDVFKAWPAPVRSRAARVRELILETADGTGTGPLTETLKWGEPAYLNEEQRVGTTVRLAHAPGSERPLRILVHCQTDLIDRYRERFGAELAFDGNRAICLSDAEALPEEPLRHCISLALAYHRDKRGSHG